MKKPAPLWLRMIVGSNPLVTVVRCVILVVLALVVFKFVLAPIRVYGPSMLPSFREGKISLVNRLAYRNEGPQRGDVVVLRSSGESVVYMKRVVGLPGEVVEIRQNEVYIDGTPLDEPYKMTGEDVYWNEPPLRLAEGDEAQYYCIGDNRSMLQEEHDYGANTRNRIVGKVVW